MATVVTTIWLDLTKTRDSQCYISFCKIDPYLISYRDIQKCIDYITKLKDNEDHAILVISTGELLSTSDKIIQECVKLSQVESVYILYDLTVVNTEICDKLSKVRGVYTERCSLCNELNLLPCIRRQRKEDFQRTDFIITSLENITCNTATTTMSEPQSPLNTSITDSEQHALEYLCSKVLRDVLLEESESSRNEMIAFCRQKYVDSPTDLNNVEEFEEYYQSSIAIFWYTRDIFLYRLINKALREQDIETLYSLRYFIKDLHQRLQERYISQQPSSLTVSTEDTVYRGQLMTDGEFNRKIRDNIGGFFSISSFLSTTRERYLAFVYAGIRNLSETSKEQGVLFEIPIDTSIGRFSYADISNESAFDKAESEILFTMGVIFRIISVTRDDNAGVWIVSLKISDEEDTHLHKISPIIKKDLTEPYKPLIKLIKIMCRMSFLETAEHFSLLALEDTSVTSNLDLLSLIYYQLGIICKSIGKLNEAKLYFKNTLNIKYENGVSRTGASLSNLYTNLGTIYENLGDLNEAHTYHNLAFQVLSSVETVNQSDLAIKYSNIASVCRKQKYYVQALQNYINCLDIESEILVPDDKQLLITKNNIGIVHTYLENYIEAIQYFQEMVETEQNSDRNSSFNQTLAVAYWNMACVFYRQRQVAKALEYSEKCERICTSEMNIILGSLPAKECQEWIQRIRDELTKQPLQIRKGYGPEPWSMIHPYRISFNLE